MLQIFGTKFYFPRLVPKRTCCEALFSPASGKNKGCTYAPRDQGEQMQILCESLQAKRENTLTPNYELIISQSLTDLEGSSHHDFMYLQSLCSFPKDWGFCQIWCLLHHASDVSSGSQLNPYIPWLSGPGPTRTCNLCSKVARKAGSRACMYSSNFLYVFFFQPTDRPMLERIISCKTFISVGFLMVIFFLKQKMGGRNKAESDLLESLDLGWCFFWCWGPWWARWQWYGGIWWMPKNLEDKDKRWWFTRLILFFGASTNWMF